MSRLLVASTCLSAALWSGPALACGGFFCSQQPVDQSKERIVFAIDEVNHTVDMHVQVFYQGESDKFAWVVPVPGVPDVHLSTDQLFLTLDALTRPSFQLQRQDVGTCERNRDTGWADESGGFQLDSGAPSGGGGGGGGTGGGVVVVASGQTGPFDWTVVDAANTAALVAWLADPDGDPGTADAYQVPPDLGTKLRPYVAGGSNFVAFKLSKDAEAGDIAPIRLTFTSATAQIPLVLTSIAAQPDMRLEIYVFGARRAVPDNYLNVRINAARFNWLGGGSNYDALVTEAANEAGGQAFSTDFFGPTSALYTSLWSPGQFNLTTLRSKTSPAAYVSSMLGMGVPSGAVVQGLLREFIPMPQAAIDAGLTESSFYNCLTCYPQYTALVSFDPVAMTVALDERVLTPLHGAQDLFDGHAALTRLTSSMSADEMTLDPDFVLNDTLVDPIDRVHTATLLTDCTTETDPSLAPRSLRLADGTIVEVPPVQWFVDQAQSEADYVPTVPMPAAAVIEDLGAHGAGEPIVQNGYPIDGAIDAHNTLVRELGGAPVIGLPDGETPVERGPCGCSGSAGAPVAAGVLGLAVIRRRRRSAR